MGVRIHDTAEVHDSAKIGDGTSIWNQSQVRERVQIGKQCILGKNVYVDFEVVIGDKVKIQNNSSLYHGLTVGDGVFIGPHVILTNDRNPRAITPDGELQTDEDWELEGTTVEEGASLGAGVIVLPGITVGRFALVGSGSVVTRDVPPFALVYGNPAKEKGFVCRCALPISSGKCDMCGVSVSNGNKVLDPRSV